jgi:hypothetical protein
MTKLPKIRRLSLSTLSISLRLILSPLLATRAHSQKTISQPAENACPDEHPTKYFHPFAFVNVTTDAEHSGTSYSRD